jgi:hypothetical protein
MSRCQFDRQRDTLCANLRAIWQTRVQPVDVTLGHDWYPQVQTIVRDWASHYRYSVDTVAAVVAALSPQVEWSRNLIIADDLLAQRMPSIGGALHINIRKAERLRDTDYRSELPDLWTLDTRMLEQFPGGPKVCSFARNLSGDMTHVTVDTHAIQAALNNPLATVTLKWTPYTVFAQCYAVVAAELGRTPADFQAIIWHAWKRLYPRVWKQQHRKQWHVIGEY